MLQLSSLITAQNLRRFRIKSRRLRGSIKINRRRDEIKPDSVDCPIGLSFRLIRGGTARRWVAAASLLAGFNHIPVFIIDQRSRAPRTDERWLAKPAHGRLLKGPDTQQFACWWQSGTMVRS